LLTFAPRSSMRSASSVWLACDHGWSAAAGSILDPALSNVTSTWSSTTCEDRIRTVSCDSGS